MKKKKILRSVNAGNINRIDNMEDCVNMLNAIKKMEVENGLKLLPINDINKLGVAYHTQDANGEISITFFDRTKTSSVFEVYALAAAGKFNIVGEDCLYYNAQTVGAKIVPNWGIQSMFGMVIGSMNFDVFVKRMK